MHVVSTRNINSQMSNAVTADKHLKAIDKGKQTVIPAFGVPRAVFPESEFCPALASRV